ncbi:MAG: YraN family protein, partial [Candidatus Thiodiazotropha endolucinida]|nr:YraN family protein [Candidatus Thiodiazotropha taylori]MCW4300020.1 YraN family protein [Candidatus Thiodiazotropha endolucinida]
MIAKHLEYGQQAEQQALDFLQSRGLRLQERNFRCKTGEIDLVMRDAGTLVFVEVRFRQSNDFLITHKPQPFSGGDKASAEYAKQQRATVQS